MTAPFVWNRVCPEPNTGCWLWCLTRNAKGYGRVEYRGKTVAAHRLSYELHRGPIPAGMLVCHTCDTPACCNPDHLWLGTPQQNALDSVAKGRYRAGGHHVAGRRKAGAVSERTRYRRARFEREGGRTPYGDC